MINLKKGNIIVLGTLVTSLLLFIFMTTVIQNRYTKAQECNEHCQFEIEWSNKIGTTKDNNNDYVFVEIDAAGDWSGSLLDSQFVSKTESGHGSGTIAVPCSSYGTYSLAIQKQDESGDLDVKVVRKGSILKEANTDAAYGVVSIAGQC